MSNEKNFPSDKADKYVIRFPDGMRDQIAEAAKANNRTMNAEIVARLQASFADQTAPTPGVELPASIPVHGWKEMMAKLYELDAEVKSLPLRLRPVPEGTEVKKDKLALVKNLAEDQQKLVRRRLSHKKKDNDQKS